jgi:hypothetical protein
LRYLAPDKNTATGPGNRRLGAAPLTGCGEERADVNKAAYPVKKNLGEKKKTLKSLKMWDWRSHDGPENRSKAPPLTGKQTSGEQLGHPPAAQSSL